jgi:hypothetical protein|tara:strand:- start:1254 stop:3788 length:2535 start_codon:yes stop_codon:yes gene_type:complete
MAQIRGKQLRSNLTGSFLFSGSYQKFFSDQVVVGDTPHPSASFTVLMQNKKGMLLPSASADPSNLSTTEEGMAYFNTTDGLLKLFDGSNWIPAGDINTKNTHLTMSADIDADGSNSTILFRIDGQDDSNVKLRLKSDNSHEVTGSVNVSGSITALNAVTSSTTITTTNITTGYPTSNLWQSNLGGSYFNNFDHTTNVSEILRFISGLLSASAPDASPNAKYWSSISTQENSLGSTDTVDGYLPQSYDSTNATMLYLVNKGLVVSGSTIFSGKSVYTNTNFTVDYDSVAGGSTTVTSSNDSQLVGLGGLTSGGATEFNVSQSYKIQFSDTGSNGVTFSTGSERVYSVSSFGTSDGVTLAKIATANPSVIPAGYQDGKFEGIGSLSRKYHSSNTNMSSSVSASGAYTMSAIIGIATGSGGTYTYKASTTSSRFYAPVAYISESIGMNTLSIGQVTQSYLTAASRSLSGVPYLTTGATYHLSASIMGLFNPMYDANSTLVDDNISGESLSNVSVAGSGTDDISTSGGTIQTANSIFASNGTVRSTGIVPTRTDTGSLNAIYTLTGTGTNIQQAGGNFGASVSDETYTVAVRAKNRESTRSTLATYTYYFHSGSTFGKEATSGSMAYYGRADGYDGGSLTGTSEAFSGESFRIKLNNNITSFGGEAFDSGSRVGEQDLQVKPGYLVDPSGSYRYWYPDGYGTGSYKYYIRRFKDTTTRTSMTVDVGKTLINWKSTADGVSCVLLFESSCSGSAQEFSRARIYDPSELVSNTISSSIAHQTDFHLNPVTDAIDLYGNTGGSKSSNEYTIPIRNADGMYMDGGTNGDEYYLILRYKSNPSPVTTITVGYS